jgi:nitrogenase iron protein NifH
MTIRHPSMQRLVFFGKGGIGKTTIASNIAVLFARSGRKVLQIGCDPKHDSAYKHVAQTQVRTVMDEFVRKGNHLERRDVGRLVVKGRSGVHCLEIGGPVPGRGCAGRAVSMVLRYIGEDDSLFGSFDVVIFDVLGDIVCGGFAAPIRGPETTDVYMVVSAEFMSIYAANNIARGIQNLSDGGGARLAGLVVNLKNSYSDTELARTFARRIGTRVVGVVPGDHKVILAEIHGKTAAEMYPRSPAARACREVFDGITGRLESDRIVPKPLTDRELNAMYMRHLKGLRNERTRRQV